MKQRELDDDSQEVYYYLVDKWRHQMRERNAVSKEVAFSSIWKINIKFCTNEKEIALNQQLKQKICQHGPRQVQEPYHSWNKAFRDSS